MLKIYFAGSIRGEDPNREMYLAIIRALQKEYAVLTEHLFDQIPHGKKKLFSEEAKDRYIELRDMDWLKECDLVVAEVTSPSHGVGIELNEARHLGKPVLCLHVRNGKKLSAMITGCKKYVVSDYFTWEQAMIIIKSFIDVHVLKE